MKLKFKDIDKRWKEYALALCAAVLFFVCITNLDKIWSVIAGFFKVLSPVFIGIVCAYIFNLIAVFFQNRVFKGIDNEAKRWNISVLVAIIIFILVIALLFVSLIPQVADSIANLIKNYSTYIDHLINFVDEIFKPFGQFNIAEKIEVALSSENGLFGRLGNLLSDNADEIIQKTTDVGSTALNWGIGVIFAIYFLLAKKSILAAFAKLFKLILSAVKFENARMILNKFNAIFSKYIACELIDACIVGFANYIFMLITNMPNALFISTVVGLTNLAPTFGPIAGAVIGGFVLLLLKPTALVAFLIFTICLQTLDGYFIKPKLFGEALNVPGVLILIGIIVFGKLFGVVGILIAIPLVAILVYIYKEMFIPWLELRKDLERYKKDETRKIDE